VVQITDGACGRRLESITDNVDRFGFTMSDTSSDEIVTEQKGVFRTNCLDWRVTLLLMISLPLTSALQPRPDELHPRHPLPSDP
jgi:hypothetical protein